MNKTRIIEIFVGVFFLYLLWAALGYSHKNYVNLLILILGFAFIILNKTAKFIPDTINIFTFPIVILIIYQLFAFISFFPTLPLIDESLINRDKLDENAAILISHASVQNENWFLIISRSDVPHILSPFDKIQTNLASVNIVVKYSLLLATLVFWIISTFFQNQSKLISIKNIASRGTRFLSVVLIIYMVAHLSISFAFNYSVYKNAPNAMRRAVESTRTPYLEQSSKQSKNAPTTPPEPIENQEPSSSGAPFADTEEKPNDEALQAYSLKKEWGTATIISDKAYFYKSPDYSQKRKAFLIKGQSAEFIESRDGFVYIIYVNDAGNTTEGWISESDIRRN